MKTPPKSGYLRYGAAAIAVVLATIVRMALDPALGDLFPFATLFFAVLIVAGSCGRGPALLATALGVLASARFLLPPRDSFAVSGAENQAGVALYLAVGVGIALLGGALRTSRRRAEAMAAEALGQGERLKATLASIGDAVMVADAAGRVTSINVVGEALTGWESHEAIGRPVEEVLRVVDEATGDPAEDPVRRALRAGAVVGPADQALLIARDGTGRPIEAGAAPIRDGEGQVSGVVLVFRDISARRRHEQALRESEGRLRLIMESAGEYAIFSMDTGGRILTWNSGARRLTGYGRDEIASLGTEALYIPEDIERGIPELEKQKAREHGRAENERWHVRKDGSRFWASGLLMPMKDGDRIVGWLKIMRDTTEQKRTEQELQVNRERLEFVVNSSEVGLWYCDLPFDKLVWNPKCKEHFGLPPDAVVTIESFYERIHPEDREATRAAIERSITSRTLYDTEFRTVDPGGKVRWIRAIGQPFFDVEGTPARFDGITVDISQRVSQQEALREADRRKDDFIATLAHELRNPLAPIRNALRLMKEPGEECEGHERERAMAERQVANLARLVDDLLDVARIGKGKIALRKEVVDLATICERAVESARPALDERGHELIVRLPDGPIALEADPTRLEQVLWNLLNNAAKYTEPGGRVRLEVDREDCEAVVRVRDTGIGIDPEKLPGVFEMFAQVDHSSPRAQGGLGIGLGLVRSLVEMHGGSVAARSEGAGTGSEFSVRLPIAPDLADRRVEPCPGPKERGSPYPSRRVLVVDDNVDAASSLARLLGRAYGQEVRVANDGPGALGVAEEFRPEVVLLDIGLPGMDGYEVAKALRRRPDGEAMRIVALTGWGQEDDRRRTREAGFDHHLVKPVDPDDMMSLLDDDRSAPGSPARPPS